MAPVVTRSAFVDPKTYRLGLSLIFILVTAWSVLSAQQPRITGPEIGSTLPSFEVPDQNSQVRNLKSIIGPKGVLLVFYKSADW
jgi:hypothetical protein